MPGTPATSSSHSRSAARHQRLEHHVETAAVRQMALDDPQLAVGLAAQEHADVDREDLVEAGVAEVGLVQRRHLERRPAGGDVVGIPPGRRLDHRRRPVDRVDAAAVQLLAHQRHRDAVPAADLQEAIGRLDLQRLDRPYQPFRRPAAAHPAPLDRSGPPQRRAGPAITPGRHATRS
jgi:hypothetical protein